MNEIDAKSPAKPEDNAEQQKMEAGTKLSFCAQESRVNHDHKRNRFADIHDQNGDWKATRVSSDSAEYRSILEDGTIYSDMIKDGKHDLKKSNGAQSEEAWQSVEEGSKEYNKVLNDLNGIDFDGLPACSVPQRSEVDKGYGQPTYEELQQAWEQIKQEKAPLIATRVSWEDNELVKPPYRGELVESVYQYGQLVAERYQTPHEDVVFGVYMGKDRDLRYDDVIDNAGKDHVVSILNDRTGFDHQVAVEDGSPMFKAVVDRVHSIDWDRVPNFEFKNKLDDSGPFPAK